MMKIIEHPSYCVFRSFYWLRMKRSNSWPLQSCQTYNVNLLRSMIQPRIAGAVYVLMYYHQQKSFYHPEQREHGFRSRGQGEEEFIRKLETWLPSKTMTSHPIQIRLSRVVKLFLLMIVHVKKSHISLDPIVLYNRTLRWITLVVWTIRGLKIRQTCRSMVIHHSLPCPMLSRLYYRNLRSSFRSHALVVAYISCWISNYIFFDTM